MILKQSKINNNNNNNPYKCKIIKIMRNKII